MGLAQASRVDLPQNPVCMWMTASPASGCPSFADVPPLDGTLHLDTATCQAGSRDLGRIVEQVPGAVLRPGSVEDIAVMIRYCRRRGIKVATQGQGHTMYGQSLAGGLLIENRSLRTIHSIGPGGADVDAGVLWKELVLAAYHHQPPLTPPLLTSYLGLSIAGTLAVGGVAVNNAGGLQIDHVQELAVVTGQGQVQRCSIGHHRDLFEVMLGGLGQCGVITRAKVDLVPAQPMARSYQLDYLDNATFFRDLRTLIGRGELAGVSGQWVPIGTEGLVHQISAVAFFDPAHPPQDRHLLRGLSVPAAAAVVTDCSYLDWALRVDVFVDQLRLTMDWDELSKPWLDVWLDDSAVEQYIGEVIPALTADDIGPGGLLLLYPQRRGTHTRPFSRIPAPAGSDWIYLFDLLTAAPAAGPDPAFTARMLARNRRLFDKARATGGTRYPIGAIEFSRADWIRHYGDLWPEFVCRKQHFDPDNILTPGPGIF